ncbi:MAG: lysophospholipase [Pirellula sp.]|jgi:pimeloyl-ACP methyl ester carboxylesterase|nr:lysophospholipase [Pirellula sp.]
MITPQVPEQELVVLIHGFGAKRAVMWPLATRLRACGYRVHLWSYVTLFQSINVHAYRLHNYLLTQLAEEFRFSIVAHSMGSIVARAALNRSVPSNFGRMVLLAPPNQGSPIARYASMLVGRVIQPTRELSDDRNSFIHKMPVPKGIDMGIIAARFDLLVPVANTLLNAAHKHETVNGTHNSILMSTKVCEMIASFLRSGEFGQATRPGSR